MTPMDRVTRLPEAAHTLLAHDDAGLLLATAKGLHLAGSGGLRTLLPGRVDAATRGADGCVYFTRGSRILRARVEAGAEPVDVTAAFAAAPVETRRIRCVPDGEVWGEACGLRLRVDGTFAPAPECDFPGLQPVPDTFDLHGNAWGLVDTPAGRQAVVRPAQEPGRWQLTSLPPGDWLCLLADAEGFVWAVGPRQWRVLCPERAEAGWQPLAADLPDGDATAVALSPADRAMAAFDSGVVVEVAIGSGEAPIIEPLAHLPEPARCLLTGEDGSIWAASDGQLGRRAPAEGAWQRTWRAFRGRLPGGGNHDVFAAECMGRIYVAGGWAGAWGLPPRKRVCDELFAFDRHSGCWQIASRMHIPRRYNGIAVLEDRVWVVGGETRTAGREGEGQALYLVDIYDPAFGTWTPGPALNHVRTDPFVVTCNGRIYAIGGAEHNAGPKLDTVESIGPGENRWRLETPLPEPTRQGHACVLDGVIYCASIDGVFAFDAARGRWDEDLPQPGPIGQGPLAAAWRGEVWVMGGHGDASTRCFDPSTRTWRDGPDLPTEQAWGAAIVVDDELHILCGAHRSPVLDTTLYDDRSFVLRAGGTGPGRG